MIAAIVVAYLAGAAVSSVAMPRFFLKVIAWREINGYYTAREVVHLRTMATTVRWRLYMGAVWLPYLLFLALAYIAGWILMLIHTIRR